MSTKATCSHCHLEFDHGVMILEDDKYFCCNGCQSVYHLLHNEGLESFYAKSNYSVLTPLSVNLSELSSFDTPSFYEKYVTTRSDELSEVSLIIDGIHCSACIWLNEKILDRLDGVVEASINFTNHKAHIVWNNKTIQLSKIIEAIRAVGYDAFAYDTSTQETLVNQERKSYYLKMAVAIFASMNIMWIAVAQYAGYFSGITHDVKQILNIAEWILSTPVLFYTGWIFFRGAYFGLKNSVVNMDLLVASGAFLTYIYSIYVVFTGYGEAYFDSVSMIITFVFIGKFLEILSKKNAIDSLDTLVKNLPSEVKIMHNDLIISRALRDVVVDDIVVLASGEKIFFDGVVVHGEGHFDESSLSGESIPVYKQIGDSVLGGTVSVDADVLVRVVKDFKHSTFSTIVKLLEQSLRFKPNIQTLANKASEYFSLVILVLAFFTFFGWYIFGAEFDRAFMISISVIVIACPCALALATPIATLMGIGMGAKKGIIFKEAKHLETIAKATVLVLDKTGTVTVGKPKIIQEHLYSNSNLELLYALVAGSRHPVSIALAEHLRTMCNFSDAKLLDEYEQIAGLGVRAVYCGMQLLGGSAKLLESFGLAVDNTCEYTQFYFAIDGIVVAYYELDDLIKDGATKFVSNMQKRGLRVVLLSGDGEYVTTRVASLLQVDQYYFAQLPEDKLHFVNKLHDDKEVVVMVGDGVNDILALGASDIAIAMGGGSDVAIEVGDVVLLDNSIASLQEAIMIGSDTLKLVKQNLFISLVYNSATIPLAIMGFIIPFVAAISMSMSSLLVILNSMRVRMNWSK